MPDPAGPVVARSGAARESATAIEQVFAAQVRRSPTATAVVAEDGILTYGELYERAREIAKGLAALGAGRETRVGLAFEHSAEAVVAIVGTVLAGGAYVPVNPYYPSARISQMAHVSDMRMIICSASAGQALSGRLPAHIAVHDADWVRRQGTVSGCFRTPPASSGTSPLAYIMFTSGSTGRAKGVMVEHRGVVNLATRAEYLGLSAADRIALSAALEFDASTFELWGALLNGATACVIPPDVSVVGWRYGEALRREEVTVAWLTAPLFSQLADDDAGIFAPLRALITGGDVVPPGAAGRAIAANRSLQLFNGYGPTENTTFTTVYPVERGCTGPLPIGWPIPGATVLVCDDDGSPVEPGTVGELYAGGAGVARGYCAQPELTASRFIMVGGQRYYRTGDRVRRDEDGLLHYLGRADCVVKIRGRLVDPSEVDTVARQVPGVRAAHTIAAWRAAGDRFLVTYVVAPHMHTSQLRAELGSLLPEYLTPEKLVALDKLPLNANGKVDQSRLPEPSRRSPIRAQTEDERRLAEVWATVLGIGPAAVDPSMTFSDLGGNSLLLGSVISSIRRRYGVTLTMADARKCQTLTAMAGLIAATRPSPAPAIPKVGSAAFDLHPQQLRLFALWQAEPESLAYNVPIRADIRGPLEPRRLRSALQDALMRHDALRMRFEVRGRAVRQCPVSQAEIPFRFHDVEHEGDPDGATATFLRPFQPDQPPLLRALLVRLGPDRHVLYLDTHHIIFDGVSLSILMREVLLGHDGAQLPAPAVSYGEVAQWSHERLAAGACADDERYWRAELAGAPHGLAILGRTPGARQVGGRAAVIRQVWGSAVLELAQVAAARHDASLYVVMLASYLAALARATGERDIVVGSPVSGRNHPDAEGLIGMFVSTVCVRAQVGDDTTLGDLVDLVRQRADDALAHQELPYDLVVEKVSPSRHTFVDAFFALQNIRLHRFTSPALEADVELLSPGTSRFPLNLQAYQYLNDLTVELDYSPDLLTKALAQEVLNGSRAALTGIVTAPGQRIWPASPPANHRDFAF